MLSSPCAPCRQWRRMPPTGGPQTRRRRHCRGGARREGLRRRGRRARLLAHHWMPGRRGGRGALGRCRGCCSRPPPPPPPPNLSTLLTMSSSSSSPSTLPPLPPLPDPPLLLSPKRSVCEWTRQPSTCRGGGGRRSLVRHGLQKNQPGGDSPHLERRDACEAGCAVLPSRDQQGPLQWCQPVAGRRMLRGHVCNWPNPRHTVVDVAIALIGDSCQPWLRWATQGVKRVPGPSCDPPHAPLKRLYTPPGLGVPQADRAVGTARGDHAAALAAEGAAGDLPLVACKDCHARWGRRRLRRHVPHPRRRVVAAEERCGGRIG